MQKGRCSIVWIFAMLALGLTLADGAQAQSGTKASGSGQSGTQSSDPAYAEDIYEDEEAAHDEDRNAIGLGVGIVQPNDNLGGSDGEIYLALNYRWRLMASGRDRDRDQRDPDYNKRYNQRHYRGRYPGREGGDTGGIRGYIEPEISYWKNDEDDSNVSDLLLGVNLVGVVPTRAADFFLGVGVGIHSFSGEVIVRNAQGGVANVLDLDDERLGANVHVGVELHVSESFGVFGSGRLDILEDEPFDRQTKIWGGIRFHF